MIKPQIISDAVMLYNGDCLAVIKSLPDNSVDSIVTDPPYGLTTNKKGGTGAASLNLNSPAGRSRISTGNGSGGFMGLAWDSSIPSVEVWAECLRVLKPGGHLLCFAGTRTQHRMACNIEDAGFEIRDMIAWVYGSGFPKSLDVSKAIDKAAGAKREVVGRRKHPTLKDPDKLEESANAAHGENLWSREWDLTGLATDSARQWSGWGTALKPAMEPITVARKPLIGTVVENVLEHGTGVINIDGCRVHAPDAVGGEYTVKRFAPGADVNRDGKWKQDVEFVGEMKPGRWPANFIHDGSAEVVEAFPNAPGQLAPEKHSGELKTGNVYGAWKRPNGRDGEPSADSPNGGAVGFKMKPGMRRNDSGSAARFFYCAKASQSERGDGNDHPTVKPIELMRYLVRLVTPPGGTVLDPYTGSGTTGKACLLEGFAAVLIEREEKYCDIIRRRIAEAKATGPGSLFKNVKKENLFSEVVDEQESEE